MLTVRQVMRPDVLTVSPQTPLKDVAQLLVDRRISGVPVVDDEGHVLGVVSEADFLVKEQGPDQVPHRALSRFIGESRETRRALAKVAAVTAGEAMTSPAVTVEPWTSIPQAAAKMTSLGVNRLPVVDDGRLVGIVTRADLVRSYVRSDDDLARTIRFEVIRQMLWLDPASFTIEVRDGVASISGSVDRRSTADMIARSIAMIPGIVDVDASVRWRIEDGDITPAERDPAFPYSPH
jgi:CBS-domain-containing membrane protein